MQSPIAFVPFHSNFFILSLSLSFCVSVYIYVSAILGIARIDPNTATTAGGTSLTITGTSFDASGTITIGGLTCTVSSWSSSKVVCVHAAGQGKNLVLRLCTVSGLCGNVPLFSYSDPIVTSVTPTQGNTAGGAVITIGMLFYLFIIYYIYLFMCGYY